MFHKGYLLIIVLPLLFNFPRHNETSIFESCFFESRRLLNSCWLQCLQDFCAHPKCFGFINAVKALKEKISLIRGDGGAIFNVFGIDGASHVYQLRPGAVAVTKAYIQITFPAARIVRPFPAGNNDKSLMG